jgi:hypothetical protein
MALKRSLIAAFAILACLMFAWATGAGRPYPASAGGVIDPTCTSSLPCIEYDNNGAGPGIRGISVGGNGLAGATKFSSTSLSNSREGLIGNDISTSGTFNAGVRGLSTRGFGVAGQTTSGDGVFGLSSSGPGVAGQSTSGAGVLGISGTFFGVLGGSGGSSSVFAGVQGANNALSTAVRANGFGGPLFIGNNHSGIDIFTVNDGGNTLIGGNATVNGTATFVGNASVGGNSSVTGNQTVGGFESVTGSISGGSLSAGSSSVVIGVFGNGSSFGVEGDNIGNAGADFYANGLGGNMFVGNNSASINSFIVDNAGNITITGQIFTGGTCNTGCVIDPKKPGTHVITYAPREAAPTMEDVGEAQLAGGSAYVHLDPAFANVIDQRNSYLVFITPEGDNRGLYVTQKSLAGFAVRESQGGRSTLAFSYRIVAKPFGQSSPRLAVVMMAAQPKRLPVINLQRPNRVVIPVLTRHPKVPIYPN